MARGTGTTQAADILYGHAGPRKLSEEAEFVNRVAKKLSEPARLLLKEMLERYNNDDGVSARHWQAFELTKEIRVGTDKKRRPSPSQAASYMNGLEKKGLVHGIQGPDMPRVQWQLTQRGRLVAASV